MKQRLYVLCVLAVLALASWAGAQSFTLEQALSAPFPSDLKAAPSGNRVAWVFDDRGNRNVWVAEGPDFKARQLTHYTADNGQEITDVEWAPDGRNVVYVRGGPKNQAGEIPNPTSDAAGAEQAVWAVSTAGGQPRKLGMGVAPAISPTGGRVAFLREGQVWVAQISGASPAEQFFQARGNALSLEWSPDGTRLAFASNRGDHSFIGVYDTRDGSLHYLAPSVDRDSDPRWSPDGKRIAFVRVDTAGTRGFSMWTDADRDQRWAIWAADADSGQGKEVWVATAREGGTLARMGGGALHAWAANDRLILTAELDGWNRLYSISVAGGDAVALSGSTCEVENLTLTPDQRSVIFNSNCGDINRRHLWRVSVSEGPPTALTSGKGVEFSPQVLADNRTLALLASDARYPASPQLMAMSGGKPRALAPETLPADFPARQLVEPQEVTFSAADGLLIHGQLFLPHSGSGRHPAVIFVHGGPVRQMLPAWSYMYYYSNAYGMNQYLASRGYVVLSVNYRCGIGYGRAFRNAPKRGARGASEYQDVVAGAQFLRARSDVDPAHIGIWGGSYGGYLTAMALARNSDLFAAGVDLHGVHDWTAQTRRGAGAATGQVDAAANQLARESSPIASIKNWRSPVLLIQGDDDRNVSFSQMVELVPLLRQQKVQFEQIVFPDEVHDFLRHASWLNAYHAGVRFFDAHLKTDARSASAK